MGIGDGGSLGNTHTKVLIPSKGDAFEAGIPSPLLGEADGVDAGRAGDSSSYKELIAKSATSSEERNYCGSWAIVSECSSGLHHFAKKLLCGREWCRDCGEDNSAAHKRRQARIMPKLQQVSQLGYFVIEFPDVYRHIGQRGVDPDLDDGKYIAGWCYSKADLRGTTNAIVNALGGKRMGRRGRVGGYFGRGLGRWHWFGDQEPGKWNPHFNVLVDLESLSDEKRQAVQPAIEAYKLELLSGKRTKKVRKALRGIECYEKRVSGYMPRPLLEAIQVDLRAVLNVSDLIVHYSYFDRLGQIVQKVRYVTRATFRNYEWDPYMANELYNFRNIRWWGNWKGERVWELSQAEGEDVEGLQAVSRLQGGICPDCGQPLKVLYHNLETGQPVLWSRPVSSVYLDIWQAREIGMTGYCRIPYREWNGSSFSPAELLKLGQMEERAWDSSSGFI